MRTDKIGPDLLKAPVMLNLGSLIQLSWGFSPGLSLHLMPIVAAYLKRQFRLPRHFIFNTLKLIHQVVGTSYLEWECK